MSRMDFSTSLSPLNTTASKKVISFSDISAVNFIVRWNMLACSMKRSTSYLTVSKGKNVINVTFPFSGLEQKR